MKINFKLLTLSTLVITSLFACKKEKEDPVIPNEEEVITTFTYTLTPVGGGDAVVLKFKDLDGDGGNAPVITVDTLRTNTNYDGALTLLNETESPAEDITEEVKEEDKEHQFFFVSNTTDVNVSYDDQDADGNPVGLKSKVTTMAAANGTLKVTLRHEPNKSGSGVSQGDITNAGGETDIEVTFPIFVK